MGKTLLEEKTLIRTWFGCNNGAVDSDKFPMSATLDCINLVRQNLARKYDFYFLQKSGTVTIAAAASVGTLPTDLNKIQAITIRSTGRFLELISFTEYKILNKTVGATPTDGRYYGAIWDKQIYLSWAPSAGETLDIYYQRMPIVYTDAHDAVDVGTAPNDDFLQWAWDVVMYGALCEAAVYGIGDPQREIFQARFAELRDNLITEQNRMLNSNIVSQARIPGGDTTGGVY
jgi:hypothetical protein